MAGFLKSFRFWWSSDPTERLQTFRNEVPNFNNICCNATHFQCEVVFGGSHILRAFTERNFVVNDTDIFISPPSGEDTYHDTTMLLKSLQMCLKNHGFDDDIENFKIIKDVEKPTNDRVWGYYDSILINNNKDVNGNFQKTDTLNPLPITIRYVRNNTGGLFNKEFEDFDKAIIGTINFDFPSIDLTYNRKVQYVVSDFKSRGFKSLFGWYQNAGDLPICAVTHPRHGLKFEIHPLVSYEDCFQLCEYGIFPIKKHPKHESRIESYQKKNFSFLKGIDGNVLN